MARSLRLKWGRRLRLRCEEKKTLIQEGVYVSTLPGGEVRDDDKRLCPTLIRPVYVPCHLPRDLSPISRPTPLNEQSLTARSALRLRSKMPCSWPHRNAIPGRCSTLPHPGCPDHLCHGSHIYLNALKYLQLKYTPRTVNV